MAGASVVILNRKTRSDTAQKQISITYLTGAGLVLLVAFGIGLTIKEFRFRSWEKNLAQVPKANQPIDIPKTKPAPKIPEIQYIQEPLLVEEEPTEPEPLAFEPSDPSISQEAGGQSPTEIQPEMVSAPPDQDHGSNDDDPAVKERHGRGALSLIGYDPGADEIWITIINDPSVSAKARSNLIEDLNEDGLSYRNLTFADLPVIQYRIELVEYIRPDAMD